MSKIDNPLVFLPAALEAPSTQEIVLRVSLEPGFHAKYLTSKVCGCDQFKFGQVLGKICF